MSIAALRALLFLAISSLLGALCAFLSQIILARSLGPSNFGEFAAALVLANLLAPLAIFGVPGFWLRIFGEEGPSAYRWLPSTLRLTAVSSISALTCYLLWALFGHHTDSTRNTLIAFVFVLVGQSGFELSAAKLQLEARYGALAILQFSVHGLRLLVVALLAALTLPFNLQTASWSYALVGIAFFAIALFHINQMRAGSLYLAGHSNKVIDAIPGRDISLKSVALRSWPFGLAGTLYLVYFQSSVLALGYLSDFQEAGIFNAAMVIIAATFLFPTIVYQKFLLPKLHRWAHHDPARLRMVYRQGNVAMTALGTCAALALVLVAPSVVPIVFGADYVAAILPLQILSVCIPVRFLATSIGAPLATRDMMVRKVTCMGIVAVLNVATNIALIPTYGAIGACVATLAAELALLVLYWLQVRKHVFPTSRQTKTKARTVA